jgi:very-short-patch-repair endonuclease
MRIKPPLPTTTLANSRHLRKEMTDSERKLWQHLRAGRLDGLKFRRQHPIPPYIADFCCIEKKLVVELDGSQHSQEADAARTRFLESQGWRVIRFWDNDVLLATEAVVEAIWNTIAEPYPHPNPSPDGRGAQAPSESDHDQ